MILLILLQVEDIEKREGKESWTEDVIDIWYVTPH